MISSGLIRYGAFRMSIRVLALALLAGVSLAVAAPPKSQKPTTDPATQQQAPEALDVDAMARAKDESAATPSAHATARESIFHLPVLPMWNLLLRTAWKGKRPRRSRPASMGAVCVMYTIC